MTDREAFEAWWDTVKERDLYHVHTEEALTVWQAAVASERAKPNAWKSAVIDKLVVSWVYTDRYEDDPDGALNDLLKWEVEVALDPKVSSQAQELIDRGAAAERAKQAEPARCKYCGVIDGDGHTGDCALALGLVSSRAVQAEPVASDNYVQPVPDHCDRITWRGQYFHLPLAAPPAVQAEPVASMCIWEGCDLDAIYCEGHAKEAFAATPAVQQQAEPVAIATAWHNRVDGGWRAQAVLTAKAETILIADAKAGRHVGPMNLYAAPPADDEAVRLLRDVFPYVHSATFRKEIDAYLAKAGK